VAKCSEFAHCRKATSFVLKQKKQKFKSPPYASFAAQGIYTAKPGSITGCLYFASVSLPLSCLVRQNLKGPSQPHRPSYAAPLSLEARI
jgi:hypothetical protein